ncbi:MAG: SDR family NAD(P)-dependent oxidoreductase, partial [Burkholderiaceae bacterium]|nr:SDR family NAD(P)-dependent oxidoreductase [Burkholderiaceae bacterium]
MKTIVITGASDGIGAEMARQLAAQHKDQVALVLAARNETLLHAVADECTALGAQA